MAAAHTGGVRGVALGGRGGALVLGGGGAVHADARLGAARPEAVVGGAVRPGEDADAVLLPVHKLPVVAVPCAPGGPSQAGVILSDCRQMRLSWPEGHVNACVAAVPNLSGHEAPCPLTL